MYCLTFCWPRRQCSSGARFAGGIQRSSLRVEDRWRWVPGDLPPWAAVYQQMRRWLAAGCFEALVADVQLILRESPRKKGQPTAVCLDSRTLQIDP